MDRVDEWTTNSNEALTLALHGKEDDVREFGVVFTYPIFGQEELIFGYQDLNIRIDFDAVTLLPCITSQYSAQLDTKSVIEVIDPVKTLLGKLPEETFTSTAEWKKAAAKERVKFKVPGTRIAHFTRHGEEFVIYKTSYSEARKLVLRMRIFVLLFIEAGSYLEEEDDKWELYLVYNIKDKEPFFAGFCSVYPYFWYKDSETHNEMSKEWPVRKRISQFVVLPPFQEMNVGGSLYDALFNEFLKDDRVREVTVEDPNERFDDLRDRCDLARLARRQVWESAALRTTQSIEPEWLSTMCAKEKMAPRQFNRCVEMALLSKIQGPIPLAYELFVKRRLYQHNYEALRDLPKDERVSKLDEVLSNVIEDYRRLLAKVDMSGDKHGKKRRYDDL
ncbi:histone acetyltransferase type B catalytic subunit [Trichomonascus vanleenenianus]|uniref:histone acetyltransferase catalytic subunit HAT1 n=1 Tax=Trichomonascus vanleenenianus TaxID=2268995 RepID=UPI003EC99C0F